MKNIPDRTWTIPILNGLLKSAVQNEVPAAITGLGVTVTGTTSFTVTWDQELQATQYQVYLDGVLHDTVIGIANSTYTFEDLSPATEYSVQISAINAIDVEGELSEELNVTTLSLSGPWPAQAADGAIHVLPDINMWGSRSTGGSGRDGSTTGVDIIIVNQLGNSNIGEVAAGLGSNVWAGTTEFALRFNSGTRAKMIIDTISGLQFMDKQINAVGSNVSWYGQFAPGPGLFLRGSTINVGANDNWVVFHKGFYCSDSTSVTPLNRDPFVIGLGGAVATDFFFVNCEFAWAQDELFGAFRQHERVGLVYCVFASALHVHEGGIPAGEETGFGPFFGGESGSDINGRVSVARSLFAHNAVRNPKFAVRYSTVENVLYYNISRREWIVGVLGDYGNQALMGAPAFEHNNAQSLIIRGPDNTSSMSKIQIVDNWAFPASSQLVVRGYAQHGWTTPATQAGFVSGSQAQMTLSHGALRANALPSGRLTDMSDMYVIAASENSPTDQEREDFVELMEQSVGVKPGMRVLGVGKTELIFNQIAARLNGTTGEGTQMADTVAEDGGWWTPPASVIVNPLDPGVHWHAPLPTASTRHDVLASGTFSNGKSKVGYTEMEAWAYEQHLYVGGQD